MGGCRLQDDALTMETTESGTLSVIKGGCVPHGIAVE